jgi:nicotinamide-nucleotide amidase
MMAADDKLDAWAQQLAHAASMAGAVCTTAESCTGGMVAAAITNIAGSSGWFDRGFVTYSNAAKTAMLGVPQEAIENDGAVSEAVVEHMALGALQHSDATLSVAISGIAGPDGGTASKPVGTVCFAWANRATAQSVSSMTCQFSGDRYTVRHLATSHAIAGLLAVLDDTISAFTGRTL